MEDVPILNQYQHGVEGANALFTGNVPSFMTMVRCFFILILSDCLMPTFDIVGVQP